MRGKLLQSSSTLLVAGLVMAQGAGPAVAQGAGPAGAQSSATASRSIPVPRDKPFGSPVAPSPAREPAVSGAAPFSLLNRLLRRDEASRGKTDRLGRLGAAQRRLAEAYPGAFSFEDNALVFPDGTRVVWDDGRSKSAAELLTEPDVEDMFAYPYPPASRGPLEPPRHHDPGRVRSDAFFRALYGASEGEVRAEVVTVPWLPELGGGRLTVTTRFGVDEKVAAISAELQRLPQRYHRYLVPSAGAFVWRQIAGTNRLSVHSFGAAVDISTAHANYWRWDGYSWGDNIPYRNQIPLEIVAVFERHCFIWGGRWYHYDTMHFEYRPELLPGCRRGA